MLDACNFLGFIFAYTVAFGWVACVLGIVAASLACCVCCQCCKAKLDEPVVQQKPPVVVGQPAWSSFANQRWKLVGSGLQANLRAAKHVLKSKDSSKFLNRSRRPKVLCFRIIGAEKRFARGAKEMWCAHLFYLIPFYSHVFGQSQLRIWARLIGLVPHWCGND